jgi:hypothetical protein
MWVWVWVCAICMFSFACVCAFADTKKHSFPIQEEWAARTNHPSAHSLILKQDVEGAALAEDTTGIARAESGITSPKAEETPDVFATPRRPTELADGCVRVSCVCARVRVWFPHVRAFAADVCVRVCMCLYLSFRSGPRSARGPTVDRRGSLDVLGEAHHTIPLQTYTHAAQHQHTKMVVREPLMICKLAC